MSAPSASPAPAIGKRLQKALVRQLRGVWHLVRFALLLWATLAIHYSNLPWPWARLALAVAFAAFGIWAMWMTRRRGAPWVFAALLVAVLAWWSTILPSHDREWQTDVAVMPRAIVDRDERDLVRVRTNFRDELQRRSDITAIARQAGDADDFPQRIRDALPGGPRSAARRRPGAALRGMPCSGSLIGNGSARRDSENRRRT